MSCPLRLLDTGLMPARWNVAMTATLIERHARRQIPDTLRLHRYHTSVLLELASKPTRQPTSTIAAFPASTSPAVSPVVAPCSWRPKCLPGI